MTSRPEGPIKVLVVEDDKPTLARFQKSIEACSTLDLVGACQTLTQARTFLGQTAPDVLITDLNLPDGNGIDLIRETRKTSSETEILVISVLGDEKTVVSAILAGASGYLLKDAQPIDMEETISQLVNGGSPISTTIARYLLEQLHRPELPEEWPEARKDGRQDDHPHKPRLTEREREVLNYIAMGYSYREIAKLTDMSQNTVPTHIKNIYRKLEVNSRGEAVYEALQRGLIDLNDTLGQG